MSKAHVRNVEIHIIIFRWMNYAAFAVSLIQSELKFSWPYFTEGEP